MGLAPINRLGHAIGQAVRSIYRITPVKRGIDSGLAFLQANGHGDSNDTTNQELLQENDLDDISHFGFESFPRANGETEYIVVDSDGGEAAIASRRVLPSALADLAEDEARIYGEEGQSVLCEAAGNVEVAAIAGKKVKLGNGDIGAATLAPIAYAGTPEANASSVSTNVSEAANEAALMVDLGKIVADLATVFLAAGAGVPTFLAPTWGNNAAGDVVAYVKTGSGTSEVEP